jgi:hypothetical protein
MWAEHEIELLKLNYENMTHADLAIILGKTSNAVRNKCHRLRLRKKAHDWTEQELGQLCNYYAHNEFPRMEELEGIFPGRHGTNICRKARELNLTDSNRLYSEGTRQKISSAVSRWYAKNEHPRGFQGHTHTEKAKEIIGRKAREMWEDPDFILNSDEERQLRSDRLAKSQATGQPRCAYSRGKMGKREDLNGLFVRSSWEANYARYLNWLIEQGEIKSWEYEADIFWFDEIKRGTRSYTPDFKIVNSDGSVEYHEVKGWMDSKSKTKLKRMAKYYPDIRVILIDAETYKAIQHDVRGFIKNWE